MKIAAPVKRIEEIGPLADAGADELYCSVVPEAWIEKFRTSGVSRRAFSNLPEEADLVRAVAEAHGRNLKISLAINAQHYSEQQLDCLMTLARDFDAMDGDAIIVADCALLSLLSGEYLSAALHVSSVASCRNREAAEFHRDLGARRVILPRDVTLAEIERLVAAVDGLEFEAFVLNDGCAFEEGLCHTIHLPMPLGGPICMDDYRRDHRRADGLAVAEDEQAVFEAHEADYRSWLWYRFGCGFSVTDEGLPYGPCALCALPRLAAAGIATVKIAGRDSPTERKVKSVALVRRVLDQAEAGAPAGAVMTLAQEIRGEPEKCASRYMCYYPDVLD